MEGGSICERVEVIVQIASAEASQRASVFRVRIRFRLLDCPFESRAREGVTTSLLPLSLFSRRKMMHLEVVPERQAG